MSPRARLEGLLVEELGAETLIYDLKNRRAHCLNRAATLVWRRCDGKTTAGELAEALHAETGLPADESLVSLALDRLAQARLLEQAGGDTRISRREVARRLGLAGSLSVLLPVVTSLLVPTPAQAGSCITSGQACIPGGIDCCVGCLCSGLTNRCVGSC
jgi:hypothetical protein